MDIATARLLCDMTSDFYRQQAASFSQTRQAPWPGWRTCVDVLRRAGLGGDVAVLDLACGNLRFESFLAESLAPAACTFYAVDNCDGLVSSAAEGTRGRGSCIASAGPASGGTADNGRASDGESHLDVRFQSLDVMEALFAGASLYDALEAPACDVAVSFGFLHHVPLFEQRVAVMRSLVDQVRPGGFVIVSFWRFLHDDAFAAKAQAEHARASAALGLPPLDPGDFVLGWQNVPGAYRYCHSFDDAELDQLVVACGDAAEEVVRFTADGRTGEMNAYVVLRV